MFSKKPSKISNTNVIHGTTTLTEELLSQKQQECIKPAKMPELSDNYRVPEKLYEMDSNEYKEIKVKDIGCPKHLSVRIHISHYIYRCVSKLLTKLI